MATTKNQKYELVILQGGIEKVGYSGTLTEMRNWFKFKNDTHKAGGWTVINLTTDSLYATKLYPDGTVKKRRIFVRRAI